MNAAETPLVPKRSKGGAPVGNKHNSKPSKGVQRVIHLLIAEPDLKLKDALERAQCPPATWYKAQSRPATIDYIRSLARSKLHGEVVTAAVSRYVKLLDAESEYVAADIAKDVLAQAGVRVTVDARAGSAAVGSIVIQVVPPGVHGPVIEGHAEPIRAETVHVSVSGVDKPDGSSG